MGRFAREGFVPMHVILVTAVGTLAVDDIANVAVDVAV